MIYDDIKTEINLHLKNSMKKPCILLPLIAPCYVALFLLGLISFYIDDFIETIKQKTDMEREKFIAKKYKDKNLIMGKEIFAFYSLIMTCIYWVIFGFSINLKDLEFLNYPTYLLIALPIEAIHQILIIHF